MNERYGGIEAGGTKFNCALGDGKGRILDEETFPTTHPTETLTRAIEFFRRVEPITSMGIAAFGPLDLNPDSGRYGWITSTPKPGWAQTDLLSPFRRALHVPVVIETDVNAAAIAEGRWGAARGLATFLYLTVGTGIGGGAVIDGRPLHGLVHPEMGHIRIPHDRARDPFVGMCPFHGDCLEGLACGRAIEARWRAAPKSLPEDHPAWALEAHYLSLAVASFMATLSPQRVILGGGVMHQVHLFPRIRAGVLDLLGGYVPAGEISEAIDEYIVPPALGDQAGILGALALVSPDPPPGPR